eukprot:TRINITY_DN4787_c1_g1_i1.p1 TRINITY_DN4787_c1_g1~~TRINITY_DN4787_c1_g1_i1.p1  ORF type:complete len:249 (-),score=27.92 TRINITY_DN4787_c1_g1_i1:296-940(-)
MVQDRHDSDDDADEVQLHKFRALNIVLRHTAESGMAYSPRSAQAFSRAVLPDRSDSKTLRAEGAMQRVEHFCHFGFAKAVKSAVAHLAHEKELASTLCHAAQHGHVANLVASLCAGARTDCRNKFGWTPLHLAAHGLHFEACDLLIKADADVNATTQVATWNGKAFRPLELVQARLAQHSSSQYDVNSSRSNLARTKLKNGGAIEHLLKSATRG